MPENVSETITNEVCVHNKIDVSFKDHGLTSLSVRDSFSENVQETNLKVYRVFDENDVQ